jgi:hypothetical protein
MLRHGLGGGAYMAAVLVVTKASVANKENSKEIIIKKIIIKKIIMKNSEQVDLDRMPSSTHRKAFRCP